MSSNQTLYDVLFALVFMVGISASLALAATVAGAMFQRRQARTAAASHGMVPVIPTTEDARELTLR
jgi:hypothetical protein